MIILLFSIGYLWINLNGVYSVQPLSGENLCDDANIALKTTLKVEDKVPAFKGNNFYGKGIWCTLLELKQLFVTEKKVYDQCNKEGLTPDQITTIAQEFGAWESRIELIEKVEASLLSSLGSVKSSANRNFSISFDMIEITSSENSFGIPR